MRRILMATSALLLLGAVPGFAQDTVEPGTGQFEPSDASDEPTPDVVDPGADDAPTIWRPLAQGEAFAPGDCVEVQPGTGQFEPSDASDEPTPDVVQTNCPQGMVPAESVFTGSIEDGDQVQPGTGAFEPSDQSDEPAPDTVQ